MYHLRGDFLGLPYFSFSSEQSYFIFHRIRFSVSALSFLPLSVSLMTFELSQLFYAFKLENGFLKKHQGFVTEQVQSLQCEISPFSSESGTILYL